MNLETAFGDFLGSVAEPKNSSDFEFSLVTSKGVLLGKFSVDWAELLQWDTPEGEELESKISDESESRKSSTWMTERSASNF